MTIGDNIKTLRERFDLTQAQLGEIAGVSDKAVSTWENGANVPRMGAIQKIADYFGIPKSEIIEGRQEEKKPTQLDELREEVLNLLVDLPVRDLFRVMEFAAELKATRGVEEARRK